MSAGTQWTAWSINEGQSNKDSQQWHIYRAKKVNGKWGEYQQRTYPRSIFPGSQQLLQYLREQDAEMKAQSSNAPSNQANGNTEENEDDDEEEGSTHGNGSNSAQGIALQMQNLRIGQPGYPNNPAPNKNPFANLGYNPFHTSLNYPRGYPNYPQRATTPAPGQTPYNRYPGGNPYGGTYGNTGVPAAAGPQHAGGGYGAQAMGYGYAGQAGAALQNPRNIARSMTAAPGASRHQSEQPQTRPNLKNFKVQKAKDYRKFFKSGRVFKAFWTEAAGQVPGIRNPFGEILRFVVLRPHRRHSICLAIHTYQNLGTTAPYTRARDHVLIYSGEREPPLVPGEDIVLLRRPAVKVTLDPKGEPLLPTSRLSLAKLYTIEHHVPTFPLGKLSSRDVERIKQYCIEVQGLFASPTQSLPDVDEDEEEEEEEEDG